MINDNKATTRQPFLLHLKKKKHSFSPTDVLDEVKALRGHLDDDEPFLWTWQGDFHVTKATFADVTGMEKKVDKGQIDVIAAYELFLRPLRR